MKEFKFELCQIDPKNCSIEELDKEILRLKSLKEEYYNLEQSIKIFINSIYGGVGSPWFEQYNVFLAEAVTLQGQDMIKFANSILDDYFLNQWHLDKELHNILGITYANKIMVPTVAIYNDTDSTYVTFGPMIESCDWQGSPIDFILKVREHRLSKYIEDKFGEYAVKYNTKNIQVLEFEKISYSGLMMAKKKYILDLAWKDLGGGTGVTYQPQEKIKPVGVEIVQGSTPAFSRLALKTMLKMMLVNGKKLQYADVVKKLKEYKKEFILQDPNDISKTVSIGDYEKYVIEDKRQISLAHKCPINVRAAAIYNHMLMNSKWKTKYNLIKTGDKIKHYYSKSEDGVFGFLPGNYIYELAPAVDYDLQYEKVMIEPFNRFMEAAGFNPIPGNLIYAKSLF
jgi:DNA polymerase elongation subunit (family B)